MKHHAKKAAVGRLAVLWLTTAWIVFGHADGQGADESPSVKITTPRTNETYSWNALVNYSIVVSYQGKSTEYQEIPANDVLLKTEYVPDLSVAGVEPAAGRTPAGLLQITHSTCLGCHSFKAKAMGPSFAAVGQRYPQSQVAIDALSQRIRKGSTGMWGQERMPAQADLTDDQLHAIVVWILQDAANPNVNYYVGTDGAFRMEAAAPPNAKGGMVLTASYTNLSNPQQTPHGENTVMVGGK